MDIMSNILSPIDMSSENLRAASLTPKKAKTRALICDTARELFFTQGIEATTIEQIATVAGTRRSTLYTHFRDKNQILTEIIRDFQASVAKVIEEMPSPQPTRAELDQWVQSFADLAAAEKVPTLLLMEGGSSRRVPDAVQDFGVAMFQGLVGKLPAFHAAQHSALGIARAQAVLRQLGWAVALYAEDTENAKVHLTVAGEWLSRFIGMKEVPAT
jgi:AcrR family transcriptional regulator